MLTCAAVRSRSAAPPYPLMGTLRKKGSLAECDRMFVEAIAQAGTIIRAHRFYLQSGRGISLLLLIFSVLSQVLSTTIAHSDYILRTHIVHLDEL